MGTERLTANFIRKAADLLAADDDIWEGARFMCNAIEDAEEFPTNRRQLFTKLLEFHGISTDGTLFYKGKSYQYDKRVCKYPQALRFDFMNLLAESMEK